MPEYTSLAKIPIPLWEEADDVPPDFKRALEVVDNGLVLHTANVADLSGAPLASAPIDTMVVVGATDAIYLKSASGWKKVWSDTGLLTTGVFSPATNWTVTSQRGRVRGGHCDVWIQLTRGGSDLNFVASPQSINMGSLLSPFVPPHNLAGAWYGGGCFGAFNVDTTGAMTLNYVVLPAALTIGEFYIVELSYDEAGS